MLDSSDQPEVRWQLVQCLPRLLFTHKELSQDHQKAYSTVSGNEASRILRVNCLQALFDLAPRSPEGMNIASKLITQALADQAASVRARARKLEKLLVAKGRTETRP